MKALLLKDILLTGKTLRSYLLFYIVFLALSVAKTDTLFFVFYLCVVSSMLPLSLITLDEREKWDIYADTLPYSRATYVSSKYLLGLLFHLGTLVLVAVTQGAKMILTDGVTPAEYMGLMAMLIPPGLIFPAFLYPFLFRLGSDKGRIVYYLLLGVCGGLGTSAFAVDYRFAERLGAHLITWAIIGLSALLYAASCTLSVKFYKAREL